MPSEWRNVRKCIIPRLSLVTIHTLRVFTGLRVFWSNVVILEKFGDKARRNS